MTQPLARPEANLADKIVEVVRSVLGDQRNVALHEPEFLGNERDYVTDCIDTGWVSSVGAYVDRFERDLARFTNSGHAIATANGTAALHACMVLAGVEPGDEVLMPALTFIATANAASYAGAVPHFVDCEERSLGVDAERLDAYLGRIAERVDGRCINRQTGARIAALVVMHVFGHPADLAALDGVCSRWGLVLVEDAAESLGSSYRNRHTGNTGRLAALSFNGNKVLTTGGGGAILTNDPELARRAKHITTTARVADGWNFVHDEIGFNYRLPNINAALGCAQLERLPDMLARKRVLAEKYRDAFAGVAGVQFVSEPAGTQSNYWLNTIALAPDQAAEQAAVLQALNDAGYMSRPIWRLMHLLPMYAACPRDDLPVSELMARTIVNLPSSPKLA